MRHNAFAAVAVFLTLCSPPLCPQEKTGEGNPAGNVAAIEISGLKRTKQHIAMYSLEKFLGRDGSTLDLNEVHAAVIETGILEPLEIGLIENGDSLTLHIEVKEKWSVFPVPLVLVNSGEVSFGLFFADTNAFGLRDTAALGGIYGNSGGMAVVMYQHTPNRRGQPGWGTFFMYGRHEREDVDRDENRHRLYTTDQLSFTAALNYPFTEYFSGSLSLSLKDISLKENTGDLNLPDSGARLLGFSPGLSIKDSRWDGFLLSRRSLSLSYGYNLALIGPSYHEVQLTCIYEQPLIPGFRFNFHSGLSWKSRAGSGADSLYEEGPQRAQVDILPPQFSARNYAGFSAGLEKHLFKVNWGTLSVMGAWQCVFSDGPISGLEFDHGPSVGTRFYLSSLALPAFGAGLAYNMSSGLFQFAFNIGMGL